MKNLIDTDWIIDFLKGKEGVVERILVLEESGLAVSIVSVSELYEGVYASSDPDSHFQSLEDFLSGVFVVGIDTEVAKEFGRQRMRLRKQGLMIDNFDLLIGATCVHMRLRLFTNNISHFSRIQGLEIGR